MTDQSADDGPSEPKVVQSVDKLVCDEHPGTKFIVFGRISGSWMYAGKALEVYACGDCVFIDHRREYAAYECDNCGIVEGKLHLRSFKLIDASGISRVDNLLCSTCGDQLGLVKWYGGFSEK